MNLSTILALAITFSSIMIVSGTNICDNAPCEPQINASLEEEFTISLESNPSAGFEWWTKFDPNYLSLLNSTFVTGHEKSGMLGVPGKETFTFNARSAGNTEAIMLLYRPWENGTVAECKIFPINIVSTTSEPKPVTVPNKIVNLETTPERKTIPINVASVAVALKQENVRSNRVNAEPISISKKDFQMSSAIGAPSQADTRKLGPRGTAI